MSTGRQLKDARTLLRLPRSKRTERTGIPRLTIKIAESRDGECPITVARVHQAQRHLERQGIEFIADEQGPTARLISRAVSV